MGDPVAQLFEQVEPTCDGFVDALVALESDRALENCPVRVTWLNHYSIRRALDIAPDAVRAMDVCGIDGQFLQRLLRHPVRTSADLIVPRLLVTDSRVRTVLAIGGCGDRGESLTEALSAGAGRRVQVHCLDGFDGLLRGAELQRLVRDIRPDLVLVGLGAGLQEQVVLEAAAAMPRGYVMTCGGFLDQVLQPGYYPRWAYPLRLNWLVRLAREPRRLWRRYSIDAVTAVIGRRRWREAMAQVPGVQAHAAMCGAAGHDGDDEGRLQAA